MKDARQWVDRADKEFPAWFSWDDTDERQQRIRTFPKAGISEMLNGMGYKTSGRDTQQAVSWTFGTRSAGTNADVWFSGCIDLSRGTKEEMEDLKKAINEKYPDVRVNILGEQPIESCEMKCQ